MAHLRWHAADRRIPLAAIWLAFAPQAVLAGSDGPRVEAGVTLEIEDIYTFDADPNSFDGRDSEAATAELNDMQLNVEADLALLFPGGFGAHATLVLEPVEDPTADRYFADLGLYAEELYLSAALGEGRIRIGKINLAFGLANDEAPGLFGDEPAGEYELTERLGIAATIAVPMLPGDAELSLAAFMADTTPFSDSLVTSRGRLRLSDGGVSNSGAPESVLVSLADRKGATGYFLGLRHQVAAGSDEEAEYGGVAAFTRRVGAGGSELLLLGEVAHFPDFDGASASTTFLNLGAAAELGDFTFSTVYGRRWDGASANGSLVTAGLDYAVTDGVALSLGYRFLEDEIATSHSIGIQISFKFGWP